jgi:hypothetical protein
LTPQFLKSAGKKTIKGIGIKKCRDGRQIEMGWARGTGKPNRCEGKERGEGEGKEGKR